MNIPILLIVFNRPNVTRKLFDEIKKQRPTHLYVAADGPRTGKDEDIQLCKEVRSIFENIDWPCSLQANFNNTNQGCGFGPYKAISWFFENVEEGIILEDDCLPDPSFFQFCQKALEKYRHDSQVMHISGNNHLNMPLLTPKPLFTQTPFIWGWASWRRAWNLYCFEIRDIDKYVGNGKVPLKWLPFFKDVDPRDIQAWDYQWAYAILINDGLCLNPPKNLVVNMGFTQNATHTFSMPNWYKRIKLQELDLNRLRWPAQKKLNGWAEELIFNRVQLHKPIGFEKILELIKHQVRKLLWYR